MPKPVKIKKKKSFMFTTKHHSFLGVLGAVVAVISITSIAWCIYVSFINHGKIQFSLGAVGLFAALADIIGIISGIIGLNERDIHRWLPIAAIIANLLALAAWILIIMVGIHGI